MIDASLKSKLVNLNDDSIVRVLVFATVDSPSAISKMAGIELASQKINKLSTADVLEMTKKDILMFENDSEINIWEDEKKEYLI